ncbi:MAG: ABC transporter ATP-binding protein/permease [Alphaproteobacteria bacterium]|nr:ABC transporter ATP-binding protein/permease [Alphaproteobacteria bacterium]
MNETGPAFDRRFFREAWALATPYWRSEERRMAWILLAVVVSLNIGLVYVNVLINQWSNDFYNTLQNFDADGFFEQLARFGVLAAIYIVIAVYQLYLNQMLQIRWRRWLTERYLESWLADRGYYRMGLLAATTDNPDQRIAEDLELFVAKTLTLGLGLMNAVVTLLSFVVILWGLSGSIEVLGVSVPGYMVWAALAYAVAGTWIANRVGRPLIGLNFLQQRYEADFRFSLVRLRENTEQVALYGGEAAEARGFARRFHQVVTNFRAIMERQKRLTFFTAGYGQLAVIFPVLVAAPRYFAKEIQLGGLIQTASAFNQVQSALSFLISAYPEIALWRSVVERLIGFSAKLAELRRQHQERRVVHADSADGHLRLDDVSIVLPDGKTLVGDIDLDLAPGTRTLVNGPSGCGKSALFRTIAGLWPFGQGRVARPRGRIMFVPQRPYLPLGTLRQAMLYPGGTEDGSPGDAELRRLLADVGLEHLAEKLDEGENWQQVLSTGEQQRLALIRALIRKPDWLFLDEATSALDPANEEKLFAMLRRRLPGTTLVSIGHRASLRAFHDKRLEFDGRGGVGFAAA